jgi:L-lysine exporter family protein LysE/ArgO
VGTARLAFGAGAIAASLSWFFGLGYGARLLTPVFAKPGAWRVLDTGIGLMVLGIAVSLVW